jgi:hypothetical protein
VRICCRRHVYDRIDIEMALGCCAYENGEDIIVMEGIAVIKKLLGLMDPKSQKTRNELKVSKFKFGMSLSNLCDMIRC